MTMPNPGYPSPEGVRIYTAGGMMLRVNCRYFDVITDKGVPTPRFVIYMDGGQKQMANFVVDRIEADVWPPGTIIMFAQTGDATDNTDRIVTRSNRAGQKNIGFNRRIDKEGRITPS